jgi:RNA polymerase sigma-70 factor (ECF subfamily)
MHLERAFEKEMELEHLSQCLETLSADQKWTVELFYLQGKCYHEIVALSGMDWNKVRSLIQNGRRNLKICMEKAIYTHRSNE